MAHLIIECTIERFSGTNTYRMSIKIEPIRGSFAELSVSKFAPLYNTLVRQHLEYAIQTCSPNLFADFGCLATVFGDEAPEGIPPIAINGTTTSAGPALLKHASSW